MHLQSIGHKGKGDAFDGLTFYGEGYGAGIQKGGDYRPDKGFILFDVMTSDGIWLERHNVIDIAGQFDIPDVAVFWDGTLEEAVEFFATDEPIPSIAKGNGEMEGWVLRPTVELFDRRGNRVITKLKVKDFPERKRK